MTRASARGLGRCPRGHGRGAGLPHRASGGSRSRHCVSARRAGGRGQRRDPETPGADIDGQGVRRESSAPSTDSSSAASTCQRRRPSPRRWPSRRRLRDTCRRSMERRSARLAVEAAAGRAGAFVCNDQRPRGPAGGGPERGYRKAVKQVRTQLAEQHDLHLVAAIAVLRFPHPSSLPLARARQTPMTGDYPRCARRSSTNQWRRTCHRSRSRVVTWRPSRLT